MVEIEAKLVDVSYTEPRAVVQIEQDGEKVKILVPIRMTFKKLEDMRELSRYGDMAILDENDNLIDWHALSTYNGTLKATN